MARLNTNAELWKALTQFIVMIDSTATPLSTTLANAIAVGGTAANLTSATNASTDDYIRVGNDAIYEVAQLEGSTTAGTTKSGFAYAHAAGLAVVELRRIDAGDISDDGISVSSVADRERIDVSTQRHAYDWNVRHTDFEITANLENLSPENFMLVQGILDSSVTGAGTTADPDVSDWTPENFDSIDPIHFAARGTLGNGNTVEVQFWDCRVNPTATITLARGQDAPLQLVFNPRHVRWLNPVA